MVFHAGVHLSRRSLMNGLLAKTSGLAVANWGALTHSQTIAAEAKRTGKRCIMLYMSGGASQIDTFDMKPGRPTGGEFHPVQTVIPGIQVCEFLPHIARHADKLGIIRSMRTKTPDHGPGGYYMHTGYHPGERFPHPECGAMIAKYCENPNSDLPSFVKIGAQNYGAGYLGPQYEPFVVADDGRVPAFVNPSVSPAIQDRRGELLSFMEQRFAENRSGDPFTAHRAAELRAIRLMRGRKTFDVGAEWEKAKDRYGDSKFGRGCFTAMKLVEAGVTFVEVDHGNHDTHNDNFTISKALYSTMDPAWGSLLDDLSQRGLLQDTLVVWTSEFGRTPAINVRAGRDHFGRAWTTVFAGGGIKGGQHFGSTDRDGFEVAENPVSEADYIATIYKAMGVDHRAKHFLGSRPIWATADGAKPIDQLLG